MSVYLGKNRVGVEASPSVISVNGQTGVVTLNIPAAITANGILKGDGNGTITAAVAGTDYGTYSQPVNGIPETDLHNDVRNGLVKIATGSIATNATSTTINYSGNLINTLAKMNNEEILLDVSISGSSVTFSTAQMPDSAISCYVIYVSNIVGGGVN